MLPFGFGTPCGFWLRGCDIATYADFLRQHANPDSRVRRLYWIYGEEEIFRYFTVSRIKELLDVTPFNTMSLSLVDTPETEIWASLNQHPLDSTQRRLLVIHEAQRLQHLDRLESWISDNQTTRGRSATAVFLSTDPEWENPVKEVLQKSSSAQYVRCSLPKDDDDRLRRAQEVICAWGPEGTISKTAAGVLAQHVNFDMGEALAVMRKASLFPGMALSVEAIRSLAPRRVEEDIVWSLIALDKQRAAEAVVEADQYTDLGRMIGTLTAHVEMLSRINEVLTVSKSVKDTAKRIRAKEQYVRRLYPYARLYPRKEAIRRTLLLGRFDDAWQQGAREGVLEALLASW